MELYVTTDSDGGYESKNATLPDITRLISEGGANQAFHSVESVQALDRFPNNGIKAENLPTALRQVLGGCICFALKVCRCRTQITGRYRELYLGMSSLRSTSTARKNSFFGHPSAGL